MEIACFPIPKYVKTLVDQVKTKTVKSKLSPGENVLTY